MFRKNCIANILRYLSYKVLEFSTCPTISDIKETSELASKLQGKDANETIHNILEWQEININYWYERADLFILVFFSVVALLVDAAIYLITKFPFFYNLGILLIGIIVGNLLYVCLKYVHFVQKTTGKKRYEEAFYLVRLTFYPKISLNNVLTYKMAICSDYTKLTAAILFNLGIKPYLVDILRHVAGAVKINGEYYVIDQYLPIKKLDEWLSEINKTECVIYEVEEDGMSIKLKRIE